MSFDIEASSSHGDFPLPQKTYKKLAQHLVDAYFRNFADQKATDQSAIANLIKRVVHTGFGYDNYEDVDIVYPKRGITESRVAAEINILLKTPLDNMHKIKTDDEEDKTAILTIGAMFDKMRAVDAFSGAKGEL